MITGNMADFVTDYKEFWIRNGLKDIAPNQVLVQGDWVIDEYLGKLKKRLGCYTVLDFGCGYGRLAKSFPKKGYLGVDLNPEAIKEAFIRNPGYKFYEVNIDSPYPISDLVLAFTVFLHMDDETLFNVLHRLSNSCNKYLIIIETLGKEWRKSGTVPVYNREEYEYVDLLAKLGFVLISHEAYMNPHYANDPRFVKRNCNTDVLIFSKMVEV